MENKGRNNRRLYVASFAEDIPNLREGDLIPKQTLYTAPMHGGAALAVWYLRPAMLLSFAFLFFSIGIATAGYSMFKGETSVAAAVSAVDRESISEIHSVFTTDDFVYKPKVAGLDAEHYLVYDIQSDAIVAASDLTQKVPIASLTKLMTAVVALDFIDVEERVAVSKESFISTMIPRLEGRNTISMESLLQLLLAESSNEAAEVFASVLGRDVFVSRMNEKAAWIGLQDTVFTDPSGLDEGNISTVRDILLLLKYVHNSEPYILELTANKAFTNPYTTTQFGSLSNFNYIDEVGFIAGKVGETLAAQQTSASLHVVTVHGEERLLAVVLLGTEDRTEDTKKLISYVREHF
ncbi:MAG: D-alanyl-D-alanine carboxypeptidase [Candidatus Azotimanducaceae bacterium]|jgi:D-alanyl-D-alanine carboxypeptidase